jgi:hypothetical protein
MNKPGSLEAKLSIVRRRAARPRKSAEAYRSAARPKRALRERGRVSDPMLESAVLARAIPHREWAPNAKLLGTISVTQEGGGAHCQRGIADCHLATPTAALAGSRMGALRRPATHRSRRQCLRIGIFRGYPEPQGEAYLAPSAIVGRHPSPMGSLMQSAAGSRSQADRRLRSRR